MITLPTTNPTDPPLAGTVGALIDAYQFARGLEAMPPETAKKLAKSWARWLNSLGITESAVRRVFVAANALKADRYALDWADIRKGALVVLGEISTQQHATSFAQDLAARDEEHRQRTQIKQRLCALPAAEFQTLYDELVADLITRLGKERVELWSAESLYDYVMAQLVKRELEQVNG